MSVIVRVLVMTALWPTVAWAQGGPPLLTDDPDTPGPGRWEINLATLLERSRLERRLETPRVDANYGVGRRIQLKFEVPWVWAREGENDIQTGVGNGTAGIKWRFVGQEGMRIAWSIYPQLEFNTTQSSVTKGIVDKGSELFLPTELTVEFAHVEINGEVGRRFVTSRPDNWIFGLSTESHVSPRLEVLSELHAEQFSGQLTELLANVGARPKLTRQLILLLAAGRTVRNVAERGTRFYLYVGLQLNLPDQYSFKDGVSGR